MSVYDTIREGIADDFRKARQFDYLIGEMKKASAMLKSPAAEYVPAMSEAWEVLDKAIHASTRDSVG